MGGLHEADRGLCLPWSQQMSSSEPVYVKNSGLCTHNPGSIHPSIPLDVDLECVEVLTVRGEDGFVVDICDCRDHRVDLVDTAFVVGLLVCPCEELSSTVSEGLVLFDDWVHPERVPDVAQFRFIAERGTVRKFHDDRRGNAPNGSRFGQGEPLLERIALAVEEVDQERRVEDQSNRSRSSRFSSMSASRFSSRWSRMRSAVSDDRIPAHPRDGTADEATQRLLHRLAVLFVCFDELVELLGDADRFTHVAYIRVYEFINPPMRCPMTTSSRTVYCISGLVWR